MNNRESFEAWFSSEMPMESLITNQDNDYKYQPAIASFESWQAAIASQAAELSSNPLQLPAQAHQPDYKLNELAQIIMSDCGISTTNNDHLYDRILGRLIASSELQSQAQQPESKPELKIVNGELCYQSTEDDQSYGMWCPVNYDTKHSYKEGTKFFSIPPAPEVNHD